MLGYQRVVVRHLRVFFQLPRGDTSPTQQITVWLFNGTNVRNSQPWSVQAVVVMNTKSPRNLCVWAMYTGKSQIR